ncbi:MAG: formate dehydrogenase accessory protein FdhE [Thermoanaerobaculia bacterium]
MKIPAAADRSVVESSFERRAARAELLASEASAAEAPLRFAAGLYRVQARIAARIEAIHAAEPLSGHLDLDLARLLGPAGEVIRFAATEGPALLAAAARAREADDEATARTRLLVFWEGGPAAREDYLSRAMLRPYAEALRAANRAPNRIHGRGQCPFCGGAPWIAVRREGSASEGARRNLACSLCGGEWLLGRILCPSCFEEDPAKLPIFQSDRHPSVRIETCENCRRYVKSIDLSLDARPIPEVDDLVSLSMDLWALEQGFSRIEPGLAGL